MGLFHKKNKEIRPMFYEGDLPNFAANKACKLLLLEDKLQISQINPQIDVSLDVKRITNIEYFKEQDFMQKYKGNSGKRTLKKGETEKSYYVFSYIGKDSDLHKFVVWAVAFESLKMMKLRDEIVKNIQPASYEI